MNKVAKIFSDDRDAERKLVDSKDLYRILFECAPDAFYLNDLEARFVDGNKMAETVIGYERAELIGKSFLDLNLLSPEQLPRAAALLAQNAQGQSTGPDEFVLNRKGGGQVAIEIRTFPVELHGRALVLGTARQQRRHLGLERTDRRSVLLAPLERDARLFGG